MSGMDASVDLSNTGAHVLDVTMREGGLRIDRMLKEQATRRLVKRLEQLGHQVSLQPSSA